MKKTEKGFTIIEVALVLAIGALIFLVIFLAVPALQRNQRNDARKRDISNVSEAVHDYNANHPTKAFSNEQVYNDSGPDKTKDLGAYLDTLSTNIENVTVYDATNSLPSAPSAADLTQIRVMKGKQCDSLSAIKTGSTRQAAIVGAVENAGGQTWYCQSAN